MASSASGPDPWGTQTPVWGTPTVLPAESEPDPSTLDGLIELLYKQRDLLQDVATHEVSYKSDPTAEPTYRTRARKIRQAFTRYPEVGDPFPWRTLAEWYGFCSQQWGTWHERRVGLDEILQPVMSVLEKIDDGHKLHDVALPPDVAWASLERRISGLMNEYATAHDVDGWQDVGRRSREILIDAVNLVYKESMCPVGDEVPKRADGKRRFEQIIATNAAGSSNKDLRGWFKAAWDLAQSTTHSGSAARASAFASGQSALTLTRALQLLAEDTGGGDASADPATSAQPEG